MRTVRTRFTISIGLVATLLLSTITLTAQSAVGPTSDWSALKAIASESKLVVKLKSGKTVEGKLTSVTDAVLYLSVKKTPMDLKREDVQSVHQITKKSATKATLIGLGVGAGAGAAIGAGGSNDNGFDKIDHAVIAGLTVIGAGVGALSGYLVGRGGSKRLLIHEAK